MKRYVIGVDLGGTKISSAVADFDGVLISKVTEMTHSEQGEEAVLDRIIFTIEKAIQQSGVNIADIEAIGIGSPGPLDAKKGIIITTPNLPFKNFRITKSISDRFNLPVFLDNDANVATIGEFMFGIGKGSSNMIFITVSTGIGGGAILNGQIYRGSTSNALEIGHTTVAVDGPRCNCGNVGCVEAISSGSAIAKKANNIISENPNIDTTLKNYNKVTSIEVFKEAKLGDKVSKEIVDEALKYLGIAVANVVSTFDPELVIIGGGVSKVGDILFSTVREIVNQRCFDNMASSVKILPAKLGTDAGIIGAVGLAIMESAKNR